MRRKKFKKIKTNVIKSVLMNFKKKKKKKKFFFSFRFFSSAASILCVFCKGISLSEIL